MGVYGDNKQSLWFVINLKLGQKLTERQAPIGQSLDKLSNDLTVDVHRVPYTIKLDQDSAQMKALEALEGSDFSNSDLLQWRSEHKGAVSEDEDNASLWPPVAGCRLRWC